MLASFGWASYRDGWVLLDAWHQHSRMVRFNYITLHIHMNLIQDHLIEWGEYANIRLPVIRVGDRVKVISKIPYYQWGSVTPNSTGIVGSIMSESGQPKPVVYVNFPDHPHWKCLLDELALV